MDNLFEAVCTCSLNIWFWFKGNTRSMCQKLLWVHSKFKPMNFLLSDSDEKYFLCADKKINRKSTRWDEHRCGLVSSAVKRCKFSSFIPFNLLIVAAFVQIIFQISSPYITSEYIHTTILHRMKMKFNENWIIDRFCKIYRYREGKNNLFGEQNKKVFGIIWRISLWDPNNVLNIYKRKRKEKNLKFFWDIFSFYFYFTTASLYAAIALV
jgi:hypothetical protein